MIWKISSLRSHPKKTHPFFEPTTNMSRPFQKKFISLFIKKHIGNSLPKNTANQKSNREPTTKKAEPIFPKRVGEISKQIQTINKNRIPKKKNWLWSVFFRAFHINPRTYRLELFYSRQMCWRALLRNSHRFWLGLPICDIILNKKGETRRSPLQINSLLT